MIIDERRCEKLVRNVDFEIYEASLIQFIESTASSRDILPDPSGTLCGKVPSEAITAATKEVTKVLDKPCKGLTLHGLWILIQPIQQNC